MNSPSDEQKPEISPPQTEKGPIQAEGGFLSTELFQGRTEILIWHNGEPYRLRQTRTGKLILNK